MPANVFANTGTNVSVLFFNKSTEPKKVMLIDATGLGEDYKEGKNKKRRLRSNEIDSIVEAFLNHIPEEDFSVEVEYDDIKNKSYSLLAGQYFDIRIEHQEISKEDFEKTMKESILELQELMKNGQQMGAELIKQMENCKYE